MGRSCFIVSQACKLAAQFIIDKYGSMEIRACSKSLPVARRLLTLICLLLVALISVAAESKGTRKLLYVATPGIRDYLEYGGHGILVFDIDSGHKWIKRIPSAGVDEN